LLVAPRSPPAASGTLNLTVGIFLSDSLIPISMCNAVLLIIKVSWRDYELSLSVTSLAIVECRAQTHRATTFNKITLSLVFTRAGITEGGPLRVSSVVHKAVIEVTEEGAEAAAATAVVAVAYCSVVTNEYFAADRPFLVALKQQGVVSFFGRYSGK